MYAALLRLRFCVLGVGIGLLVFGDGFEKVNFKNSLVITRAIHGQ